jgi:hypothetical protein
VAGVAVQDADVEVVDQDDDVGAAAAFGQPDVVEPAVVAQGDDAGGVDSVVADPVVRRALVGGGEGVKSTDVVYDVVV